MYPVLILKHSPMEMCSLQRYPAFCIVQAIHVQQCCTCGTRERLFSYKYMLSCSKYTYGILYVPTCMVGAIMYMYVYVGTVYSYV